MKLALLGCTVLAKHEFGVVRLKLREADDTVAAETLEEGILVPDGVVIKAVPAEFGSLPDFNVFARVELTTTVDTVKSEEGKDD